MPRRVCYNRSCALPIAWQVRPGHCPGAWLSHLLQLLDHRHTAVPSTIPVLILADRGGAFRAPARRQPVTLLVVWSPTRRRLGVCW
jgi:hypothetical protein